MQVYWILCSQGASGGTETHGETDGEGGVYTFQSGANEKERKIRKGKS